MIKYPSESGLALLARNFGDTGDGRAIDMMYAFEKLGLVSACGQLCFFHRDEYLPFLLDVLDLDGKDSGITAIYTPAEIVKSALLNQEAEGRHDEIVALFRKHFDLTKSVIIQEDDEEIEERIIDACGSAISDIIDNDDIDTIEL